MRIFSFKGYTGALGYIHRDSIETLQELGHQVHLFRLASQIEDPGEEYIEALSREVEKFNPDFIFAMNHIGVYPKLLDLMKVPYVSWFVDNPFRWTWSKHFRPSPYCCLFTWDKVYIDGLRALGFKNILYLPIASNPKKFRKIDLIDEDRVKFDCNISFGGESMYRAYRKAYEGIDDPIMRQVVDEAIEIQGQNPLLEISDILEGVEKKYGVNLTFDSPGQREAFKMRLEVGAMAIYRGNLLKEICDLGLTLCGDPEWKILMQEEMKDGNIRFLGYCDNREDLPKLYNASKINLNMTKSQLRTALPMRVFDISACGAFLLTDYRRDLGELFSLDEEIVCYRDKEELREKAIYYLDHPDERRQIAERARERVLSQHTYRHRIEEMLNKTKEIFGV